MIFRARIRDEIERDFYGLEDGALVAIFEVVDEDTLIFKSSTIALLGVPGGIYAGYEPAQ